MNLLWILICMIWYLCNSLQTIGLVWLTRLVFLAMGEVLSFGFNLAVSFPSDSRGSKARIVLLPSRIKRWGFSSYCLSLFLYIMSSYLMRYSVLHEINTLDAGRSRLMCGVIVVDAESFWSTWHGCDAYMHNHCLGYRHNFVLFYQLLDNNLFTHRNTYALLREATSETYVPRVYLLSYKLSIYFYLHLYFSI